MSRFLFGVLVLIAVLLLALQATAQSNCAPRAVVAETLSEEWGEAIVGAGLQTATSIFEVWAAEETGTWTIILTTPDGRSCVIAEGTDWRKDVPVPKGVEG